MAEITEAHRIAVISDTHGLLRPEIMTVLQTCQVILHAGDIDQPEILDRLQAVTRTYAVRGNADREWAADLPVELEISLFGFRFYMIHNKKHIRKGLEEADIVIYGHSHKYEESVQGKVVYLNPGSCGQRRFRLPVTMMVLTIYPDGHRIETEKIECSPGILPEKRVGEVLSGTAPESATAREIVPGRGSDRNASAKETWMKEFSEKDMDLLIRKIIKAVDAGKGIEEIAACSHVDEEFAAQICRIYVTHPGVDIDGIMDRIERKNL